MPYVATLAPSAYLSKKTLAIDRPATRWTATTPQPTSRQVLLAWNPFAVSFVNADFSRH